MINSIFRKKANIRLTHIINYDIFKKQTIVCILLIF
nr:MAG TPA: hypothetical protein [Inoviridae sp.]